MDSIHVFRVDHILFPRLKSFPCSFASRQFILPEFGRHLRRFVCVPINSRLPHHSNISIILVHHLSLQQPFPTVFSFARSSLASLSFRSVQEISGDSSVFQLIRGCHLIQIFQLFRCIIYLFKILSNGVISSVGPNPQVFSQDLTRLFLFFRSYSQFCSKCDIRMNYHQSYVFLQDLSNSFHC